jgi:hypothetical protein
VLLVVLCFVLFRYAKFPDFSAWVAGKTDSSEMLGLLSRMIVPTH